MTALAVIAACGSGGGTSAGSTTQTTLAANTTRAAAEGDELRPCDEDRHAVIVDMDGTLTALASELALWEANPAYDPPIRPGAVDLLQAWRALGYEIVYLTDRRADTKIGGASITDATAAWLARHGFPTGTGTHLFVWDTGVTERVEQYKTQTLIDLGGDGLSLDYGYTDASADVLAYRTAGIAADHIFTIGDASGFQKGTVAVPGLSWLPHQAGAVDPLPPVCKV
jgi:phosphatidate phosphatase PAH1